MKLTQEFINKTDIDILRRLKASGHKNIETIDMPMHQDIVTGQVKMVSTCMFSNAFTLEDFLKKNINENITIYTVTATEIRCYIN